MYNVFWTDNEGENHHQGFISRLLAEIKIASLLFHGFKNVQSDVVNHPSD